VSGTPAAAAAAADDEYVDVDVDVDCEVGLCLDAAADDAVLATWEGRTAGREGHDFEEDNALEGGRDAAPEEEEEEEEEESSCALGDEAIAPL
jgi:hypothetical protein